MSRPAARQARVIAPPGPEELDGEPLPPGQPFPPAPAPAARAKPGRHGGELFAGFMVATFCTFWFQLAPALAGSALAGGAAVWAALLGGTYGACELTRHWWRRPNASRWRGAAATARAGAWTLGWAVRATWAVLRWAGRRGLRAVTARGGGGDGPGPGPGPWLLSITSRSGRAISGLAGPLCLPGEQPGQPTTVLFLRDWDDLDRRAASAATDPDLEIKVHPAPWPDPPPAAPPPADWPARSFPVWHADPPADGGPDRPGPAPYELDSPLIEDPDEDRSPPPWPWPGEDYPPPGPGAGRPGAAARPVPARARPGPAGPAGPWPAQGQLRITSAHGHATPGWENLISETSDGVSDSDEDWLAWSRAQVLGMGRYAQALIDRYEAELAENELDEQALRGMVLFAEAAADSCEAMTDARRWFVTYLAEYRHAAQQGKKQPKAGYVTGEGEAD